jgi:hypothetical protein
MRHSKLHASLSIIFLAALATGSPAKAAVSPAEVCRDRVALEARKFFGSTYKARQQCQDDMLRRKLPGGTDCATESRAASKITRAAVKLEAKIQSRCTDADVAAASFAAACATAATVEQLVACTREANTNAVIAMLPDVGDLNLVGQTDAQKCRKTAATEFRKVADKRMKEAQKCQSRVAKGQLEGTTNCIVEAEANPRQIKFEQRVENKLASTCGSGETSPIARAEFPAPCGMDDSGRFYPCTRCNLSTTTNTLLQAQGVATDTSLVGLEPVTGACIPRATDGIALANTESLPLQNNTLELDFYRNTTYACGLTGNYTFMVLNPLGNPDGEAPLWVWLHGGGQGYFDDDGAYVTLTSLDENSWNNEESFADLQEVLSLRIVVGNGQTEDQTLRRRILEGYRLLVVSMCDHDWYSGIGTPYPNNPVGGEVNGLQATMSAIDYVAANYPTTQAWAHGTSAGSFGAWALGRSFAQEGRPLTGIVADSGYLAPNSGAVFDEYLTSGLLQWSANFDLEGTTQKIGVFADFDLNTGPEPTISELDFRAVPSLFIGGASDPACAGTLAPIAEASALGMTNCEYSFNGVALAIAGQDNSPHEAYVLPNTGHVPTNDPGPANDLVNDFISKVMTKNPPPFGPPAASQPPTGEPEATLGASFACPWDESDPTLHVFLAAGQSNMVSAYGQPGTLPALYETGTDQLQMWDQGSWKRLGLSLENGNSQPRYGPELAFAWTLHAACPNSNIGIIKYAVGGTSIDTWIPAGENAAVLQSNISAALLAGPDITFEGFLYHQGGGDSRTREQAESWGSDFVSIVDFTRAAAPIAGDLTFLVATARVDGFPDDITDLDPDSIPSPDPTRPFIVHVVHQQWMVQFERPGIYVTINRDILKGADGIHDTPDGIRTKGRNFAETFLAEASGAGPGSPSGAFLNPAGPVF